MAMDLKVLENVQKLTWNFDDVKAELTKHIADYVGLVVNDKNLESMEKTQREIASLRIKIGKFKTAVKKDYNKPFEVFEMQVSELAKLVESAEKPIKDQLEKYEVLRRESKSVEVQGMIDSISAELGLQETYKQQIVIADKYLNRTQKKNDTREDIQQKVCWFLDIQNKDIAEEANRIEKINMAKMMCEFLSKGLITPLTFAEIENKIPSLNITELRTYIENQVASRKEREERSAQVALERAEQERIAEANRIEKAEQERIAEVERQASIAESYKRQLQYIAEQKAKQVEVNNDPVVEKVEPVKLYNAKFVVHNVTKEQVKTIDDYFKTNNFEMKYAVKEV